MRQGQGRKGFRSYEVAVHVPTLELLRRVRFALALGGAQVDNQRIAPVFGLGSYTVLRPGPSAHFGLLLLETAEGTLASPPQSSHTACHALGANFEASKVLWCGMFVLTAFQVVLSSGSMPSRVQTFSFISAACSLVNALGILSGLLVGGVLVYDWDGRCAHLIQPWVRKCSFSSGVRAESTAIATLYRSKLWCWLRLDGKPWC